MRILVVSNLFPPVVIGGYELACSNVANGLVERGHEVLVLTSWSHLPVIAHNAAAVDRSLELNWLVPYESEGLVRDRHLHGAVCSSYANTLKLLETIRRFRPDIVSMWNPTGIGGLALMDLLNVVGVPWSLHLGDRAPVDITDNVHPTVRGLFNAQGSNLYAKARVLPVSQHLLDEIKDCSGITFPLVDIIAGWANSADVQPHEPYRRDGKTRFVAAGGIYAHKGLDLIIEASVDLRRQDIDFSVDIYGSGHIPEYLDKIQSAHLQNHVRLLGSRTQKQLLQSYATYDAFLCPTWERDPFPFAPLEAAACATPPIVTRNCGTCERLVDQVHCIKIDRTTDDLAAAMLRVATGQVDLQRLGRAGQRMMKSDLSFERYLERTEAILHNHAKPWRYECADDPSMPLVAFIKHNLSVQLRFG